MASRTPPVSNPNPLEDPVLLPGEGAAFLPVLDDEGLDEHAKPKSKIGKTTAPRATRRGKAKDIPSIYDVFARRLLTDVFDRRSGSCDDRLMALIETEEAARRLARAIASDLSLYNEDKIVNGITNDNLFESLAEEIEEGRALYKRRVSPDLYAKNYYDRALVDILIKAKGHIKSKLW